MNRIRTTAALAATALGILLPTHVAAQRMCVTPVDPYDSGGILDPDEGAYDVTFYEIGVEVMPDTKSISGTVGIHARMVHPSAVVAFDLDTLLSIESVTTPGHDGPASLPYIRCGGRVSVGMPHTLQPGSDLRLDITYGGRPRVAPRPPWDGGFTWATTSTGAPWIATTHQMIGGDVWWPMKDHVSDKPDSVSMHVTVPGDLVVATNGRLQEVTDAGRGRKTFHWFVSTPINAYNLSLNIAPYRTIETTVTSVAGDDFPVVFYVLPEDYEKGVVLFDEILEHLRWFENKLGPYPFRADKYGVVQTPHLGMEHQTIIAYGANFNNGSMTGGVDWGFDALHHHEFAHEWWANLVTNADWKDMWIHEGFGSYMQYLWMEDTQGPERARQYAASWGSAQPVAARGVTSAQTIYNTGYDIYSKGAKVLHVLRGLMGDEAFFSALRHMAYPTEAAAQSTDGSAVHFVETSDFQTIAEAESGMDLDWFFNVYVYQGALPTLSTQMTNGELRLRWTSPLGGVFPLPVPVTVNGTVTRVPMTDGTGRLAIPSGAEWQVDPMGWLLRTR